MSDLSDRLAKLSPEKLELLRKKLAGNDTKNSEGKRIGKRDNGDEYPMSFSQQRLWFLWQLDPESAFYNIPSAIRLRGTIQVEVLEKSIAEILKRHEILRAFYRTDDHGAPQQIISEQFHIPLKIVDLNPIHSAKAEEELAAYLKKDASEVFRLDQFPLIKAKLYRINPEDHILFLNMHHIITDGWSLGIFIRELIVIYQAYSTGQPDGLPEPVIQFADYAQWQQNQALDERHETQLEFWKNYLAGMSPTLDLLTDKSRPPIQTFNGRHFNFPIEEPLADKLRALSKELKISLFALMMTAFQVFLYKISGQEDFGVGAPIANRNRRELEEIIGFFVNTVVLRANFSKTMSIGALAKKVYQEITEVSDHQDVPFEKIVGLQQTGHDLSHSPLFQVMMDLQTLPFEKLNMASLTIEVADIEIEVSKFDLMLLMVDNSKKINATFEYNTDLFNESTVSRWGEFFITILDQIAVNPESPISELTLISKDQAKLLLEAWNQTASKYPAELAVNVLFEQQVEKTPGAIAIEYPGTKLSYKELNHQANRFARYLIGLGIKKDDLVTLYLERSPELFIAILGILKAGAVYVPLDTAYPKERIAFMLEDTNSPLIITQSALLDRIPESSVLTLIYDKDNRKFEDLDPENLPAMNAGTDRAYVLYTSGSTGIPKGVIVPHRAISRLVINTNYIEVHPSDRVAQINNVSFDAATFELWGAFLNGATLVGIPKDSILMAREFAALLRHSEISIMIMTTALFNQIIMEIPSAFQTLRALMVGGDVADLKSFSRCRQEGGLKQLINVYGPTENTTFSTTYEADAELLNFKSVPIGKAIMNSNLAITDKDNQVAATGVPGELFVGGDGLALGYLNRPELTAERFIANPFPEIPGKILYRTGDLVRYLESGQIEFIGRMDQQVKIRGFRVELGEIESVIKSSATVKDAVVIAKEDMPGAKQLIAYVVPKESASSFSKLKDDLRTKLPDYMIPAIFVSVSAIPLTPNGKVDRKALPDPKQEREMMEHSYAPPRNALEEHLCAMWQDILGVEKVGIHDNFFDIGGNSLKAAVFANRIQKEFDEVLHVGAIFKAPRISELTMYITEYFGHLIKERFGIESETIPRFKVDLGKDKAIDRLAKKDVGKFRQIIHRLPEFDQPLEEKNKQAVFLLSPPRSGSTLLRIMLAGNPQLFSPPELDLLSFNTLQERFEAFSGNGLEIWLEAPIRAIMEINQCDVNEAQRIMAECRDQNFSIKQFYALLQDWIEPRLIVDKTPTYGFDMNILKRAEDDFDKPLYIHLIRHPYAMIYSFIEAKLDQNFFRYDHPFTRRELAELIWIVTNQNILEFQKTIPDQRMHRIYFESLVTQPEDELKELCRFLKIGFHPEMLKPYEGKKMTDGVTAKSQMVGDFKFYLHKNINSSVANKWKDYHSHDFLSDMSWELAEQFGYDVEKDLAAKKHEKEHQKVNRIKRIDREQDLVLSFAQQRLWFLDQMEPDTAYYNIPGAIRLKGPLNERVLNDTLNKIIQRHENLRTIFRRSEDGVATQHVLPSLKIKIQKDVISDIPKHLIEGEIQKIANLESGVPFNLAAGPLLRARLIRFEEDSHILIIVMHHIISDGWSMNLFIQELTALYNAAILNTEAALPDLPVQYIDYAYWQRQWLNSGVMEKQLEFWKKNLAGLSPFLELPTDFPRPELLTHRGIRTIFHLPGEVLDKIRTLAQINDITVFMTFLALFETLLFRYSRQEDFAIGTPVAGRNNSEIEPLIGFFVNTIVLRADVSGQYTFSELLQRVKKITTEAFDNQDIPFEKLVDAIQPERDMSHTPLFQVMFSYQRSALQAAKLEKLELSPYNISSGTAKFDLSLEIIEHSNRAVGIIEYRTDLFKDSTIQRMISHFQSILDQVVDHPEISINRLNLLSDAEKKTLKKYWTGETLDYRTGKCIHQLFEEQVQLHPDRLAVLINDQKISYAEMNRRANQLARTLKSKGLQKEEIVGILMERSLDMVVAIYAVLKAGGAYLPLDPTYPEERIRFILDDAQAPVLLTQSGLANNLSLDAAIISLDSDADLISGQSSENLNETVNGENLAYVIYTSGSTGRPKGVMIEHRSALNLAANLKKTVYDLYPDQKLRISLNAPIPFDASVQQLVMLTEGHTLCIVPADVRGDGSSFLEYIRKHKIEVVDCVPSQLRMMIDAGLFDDHQWQPKAMLPGGEAIDAILWKQLVASRNIIFYNMYGPTECTVDSTICPVKSSPAIPVIGKPVANTRFYIIDENHQPVPVGVAGELCIAGAGLARGYLNRPELTAEKFISDPFTAGSNTRLYKTGDLARFLEDGNVEFLGRIDQQVKVRGFRLELGEIEVNLKKHTLIRDAVVLVTENNADDRRLVAYLVANSKETVPGVSGLREHLKRSLPDYMVPAMFMFLDSIPLLPNGKVNRQALPEAQFDRSDLETELIAASNEVQETLVNIWQEVLGIESVGIRDSFFELGGDSILSIQVIARARKNGISITPRQLFEYPTIEALSEVAGVATKIVADQGAVTGQVPLTPIQRHFFEQNFTGMQHWNQSVMLEVAEDLNPEFLKEVVAALISHHDMLRARFIFENGHWQQNIEAQESVLPFECLNLSTLTKEEQDKKLAEKTSELQAGLNFEKGPILRIAYFILGETRMNRIFIAMHHLAIDGVSWRILMEDLQAGYRQKATGQNILFQPKSTSYKQWAEKLVEYAKTGLPDTEINYWQRFASDRITPIPVDLNGRNTEDSVEFINFALDEQKTKSLLSEIHPAYQTQINDILIAALSKAMQTWTQEDTIYLQMEGHGREDLFVDADLSRTIGWFTTLFPVRITVAAQDDAGAIIRAVKNQLLEIPNKGIGFGILKYLVPENELQKNLKSMPVPEIVFNYLGQFGQHDNTISGFRAVNDIKNHERHPEAEREFLIDISASIRQQQLQVRFAYSRNRHQESTIRKLADAFLTELNRLIDHCLDQAKNAAPEFITGELTQDDFKDILAELDED